MADVCTSEISVRTTDSEWREIVNAFQNSQIEWPSCLAGPICDETDRSIFCENRDYASPWLNGQMAKLSRMYPSAIFYYDTHYEGSELSEKTCFCNGANSNDIEPNKMRNEASAGSPGGAQYTYHYHEVVS